MDHLVNETHTFNFSTQLPASSDKVKRLNGTKLSHVIFNLNPALQLKGSDVANVHFQVIHAEVPSAMYIIPDGKNTVVIDSITYTLQAGNYGFQTMITALTALLPSNLVMTYNSIKNRFVITNTLNVEFTVNASTTAWRYLGMADGEAVSSSSYTLTFPFPPNFLPTMRLSFCSPSLLITDTYTVDGTAGMFLSLQNNATQLSSMLYSNPTNTKYLCNAENVSTFEVQVIDDDGAFIDFQNVGWFITCKFEIERWI